MSGCLRAVRPPPALPTAMPACGPPSSLSPENVTRSAPLATDSRRSARREGPTSFGSRDRRPCRCRDRSSSRRRARCRSRRPARASTSAVKPTIAKLLRWTLSKQSGVRTDRALVVARVGLVRRADLDELRARQREDLGQPERAADLDQLAARDDDLLVRSRAPRGRAPSRPRCCCTTIASSAPVRSRAAGAGDRGASRARPCRDRTRGSSSRAATSSIAARAASASGARPRFVWRTTPVALITRRSGGRDSAARPRRHRPPRSPESRGAREDRLASLGDGTPRSLDERPARDIAERGGIVGEHMNGGELGEAEDRPRATTLRDREGRIPSSSSEGSCG